MFRHTNKWKGTYWEIKQLLSRLRCLTESTVGPKILRTDISLTAMNFNLLPIL